MWICSLIIIDLSKGGIWKSYNFTVYIEFHVSVSVILYSYCYCRVEVRAKSLKHGHVSFGFGAKAKNDRNISRRKVTINYNKKKTYCQAVPVLLSIIVMGAFLSLFDFF